MPTQKKIDEVKHLADLFSRSNYIVATEYRGLTVADMTQLRKVLRPLGVEYHVVKNTLAKLAAEQAGKKEIVASLQGPIGLAFGAGDVVASAKALTDFKKASATSTFMVIRGALVESRVFTVAEVARLVTLPKKEVLVAKLLGLLQSPVYRLQSALVGNQRNLLWALEARKKQLGETPGAAQPA